MAMSVICTAKAENKMDTLTQKEQNIALVGAYAAKDNQDELSKTLEEGLDMGITVNEYKEILVQVYAYCGFPRSLNALGTFMKLLQNRQNKDIQGKLPSALPKSESIVFGTENQTKLAGRKVTAPIFDFAPAIDLFLKAHLFGDIFGRDNLDWRTREIATIGMLAAMDGVESQLQSHIAIGKNNGISHAQSKSILQLVKNEVNVGSHTSPFSFGIENTAYAKYFSGQSWLCRLAQNPELGVPISNVTFEPKCRNNWHSHSGGQILIAVGGQGYYQEKGKPARLLKSGDLVEIAPNVVHWHGASPDSWFSHLAIECNPKNNKTTWLAPVSDAEYTVATTKVDRPL